VFLTLDLQWENQKTAACSMETTKVSIIISGNIFLFFLTSRGQKRGQMKGIGQI
jgi:hypothetical protein